MWNFGVNLPQKETGAIILVNSLLVGMSKYNSYIHIPRTEDDLIKKHVELYILLGAK